jgi:hypothetical protein
MHFPASYASSLPHSRPVCDPLEEETLQLVVFTIRLLRLQTLRIADIGLLNYLMKKIIQTEQSEGTTGWALLTERSLC